MEKPKEERLEKIRIKIFSHTLPILDEVTAGIVGVAKGMHLTVAGPFRLPMKILNTVRRLALPPRQPMGIKFRGNLNLQLYGASVEVFSSMEVVDRIISGYDKWNVEIEFLVVDVGCWRKHAGREYWMSSGFRLKYELLK